MYIIPGRLNHVRQGDCNISQLFPSTRLLPKISVSSKAGKSIDIRVSVHKESSTLGKVTFMFAQTPSIPSSFSPFFSLIAVGLAWGRTSWVAGEGTTEYL